MCGELRVESGSGDDPVEQMGLRNHLFADLEALLERFKVKHAQYRGDGVTLLFQGADHARRAVETALAWRRSMTEFNRPRRVLGWPLWQLHTGISSGTVAVGAMGSYRKLDSSAGGSPLREADALLIHSQAGLPCIGESTYQLAGSHFCVSSRRRPDDQPHGTWPTQGMGCAANDG